MDRPRFSPPEGAAEREAVIDIEAQSFALAPPDAAAMVEKVGLANFRVLRERGEVVAMALPIPMGQWYGGRRVPMAGVGGVGVSPRARGQGTATQLMREVLQEMRGAGFPLSVLYPSTQTLYRRVGYEQAGSRYEIRAQVEGLDFRERALALRPIRETDHAVLQDVYRRQAASRHGFLDRVPHIWNRVHSPRNETAYGFLVEGAQGVEGYVYLVRRRKVEYKQELVLTDFVALTPTAARRLLSFLGDHKSLALEAVWSGGPADPWLFLLQEQTYQVKLLYHWMLRVLDVPAALEARGYPEGLSGTLHLEVEDELFSENRGRFMLHVSEGKGRVERGGEGQMRLNIRALAPLYSGFLTPEALRSVGALAAEDACVRRAAAIFTSPPPVLPDMF
ncbi:GNAT family N-acetyltransferase [Stigmatella sp. ncwal1]|uniref:GNAT family N-acetyltransferase n=1 Tax=Stigmatella ashevillensis TaxID=2995309 RepID=A0ABT5D9W6_9BACT|nr:GNAT family N-acetyltransferase [Stigmatella ashevillena]MDC0709854.1 GNAT family N-acetyltransferase [Stigmatella ashevillena]